MKKLSIITLILAFAGMNLQAQTWKVDNSHSSVEFSVSHMVISQTKGNFKEFTLNVENVEGEDWSKAKATANINVSSVNTEDEKRDGHLLSEDFFAAEKFPEMTFESTSFKKKSGKEYAIKGKLTIRGITKDVEFDAKMNGTVKDPWGNTRAGWSATTTIDRMDYDLKWSQMTEAGGLMVGNEVEIILNFELIKG